MDNKNTEHDATSDLTSSATHSMLGVGKLKLPQILQNVNDALRKPFVNKNGSLNYGLYTKDGVMFIDAKDIETYNQMAGENAKTAALDKLNQAKEMEQAGKLPDDIYKETGWLKGKDGKWRFEIPDNLDAINAENFISEEAATKWSLGRLYENAALYEAYPYLRNVPVFLSAEMPVNVNGVTIFSPVGQAVKINYRNGKIEPEQLKKTLLHEIQHIIQRKEGFANGGSAETVMSQINDTIADLELQLLEGITDEWSDDIAIVNKAKELVKTHNNIELQNIISEPKEVEENRKKLAEIKADIEELVSGKKAKDVFDIVSKIRKLEVLQEKYQAASPEEKEKLVQDFYQKLAGEQEANMVARRANREEGSMSKPEPHGYNAIVVFGGVSYSAENSEAAEINKYISSKAIPVESKVFVGDEKQKAHIKAVNWFKKEYGLSQKVPTVIGDIVIHYQGIKSSLAHKYSQKKLDCVSSIVEGMKQASYIKSIPDYDDKRITNHYFVYKVMYEGEENYVLCRIREQNNVQKFYIHEVGTAEEIKIKSDTLQTRADGQKDHETPRGIALYTSILSEFSNKIKKQMYGYPQNSDSNTQPVEKFNQGIKGSITPMSNGKRIINIFEAADESTFLHEMGHLFLLDLEELAQIDEKSAQELSTVTEWATYKKEDVKGYKGTPFESEFLKLAANIEAAEKNGDITTAEQLKRKWMHERFARAFEMYLEFGQAPSTGLKSVFRKFKQFLIHIYIGFTGEGVRATPEVERIMARMVERCTIFAPSFN